MDDAPKKPSLAWDQARWGWIFGLVIAAIGGVSYEAERVGAAERGREARDREVSDLHQDVRELRAEMLHCKKEVGSE